SRNIENTVLACQPPQQPIQGLTAGLTLARIGGLLANSRGLSADYERHHQHRGKGKQVFIVMYPESKIWRHAEKIKRGDAEERGHNRDLPAAAQRDRHNAEQVNHYEIS